MLLTATISVSRDLGISVSLLAHLEVLTEWRNKEKITRRGGLKELNSLFWKVPHCVLQRRLAGNFDIKHIKAGKTSPSLCSAEYLGRDKDTSSDFSASSPWFMHT